MGQEWIAEKPAIWDEGKQRIIAGAPAGTFDRRFQDCQSGEFLPGEWWRVEEGGRTVGYGWLDVVWGDAEIQLATDPDRRGQGIGPFILHQLEREARQRGLNYLYNLVRSHHPDRKAVSAWLTKHGFKGSEDGSLFRVVTKG